MTKIKSCASTLFLLIAITISAIPRCSSTLSDKRLCFDPKCSVPISKGKTTLAYNAGEPHVMSFPANVDVTIYSKNADKRDGLWGAEINGKRGYVPKSYVREYKVINGNPKYEVPVEEFADGLNKSNANTIGHVKKGKSVPEKKGTLDDKNKIKGIVDEAKETKDKIESDDSIPSESTPKENVDIVSKEFKESKEKNEKNQPLTTETVAHPYDIIDGTTIALENEQATVNPTNVVETTVTPTAVQRGSPLVGIVARMHPNLTRTDSVTSNSEHIDYLQSSEEVVDLETTSAVQNGIQTSDINGTDQSSLSSTVKPPPPSADVVTSENAKTNDTSIEKSEIDIAKIESVDEISTEKVEKENVEQKEVTDSVIKNEENKEKEESSTTNLDPLNGNSEVTSQIEEDAKKEQNTESVMSMNDANTQDTKTESINIPGIDKNEVATSKISVEKEVEETSEKKSIENKILEDAEQESLSTVVPTSETSIKKEVEETSGKVSEKESTDNKIPENTENVSLPTAVPFFATFTKEDTKATGTPETKPLQNDTDSKKEDILSVTENNSQPENIIETKIETVENVQDGTINSEKVVDNAQEDMSIIDTEIPTIEEQNVNNDNLTFSVFTESSKITHDDASSDFYKQRESLQSSQQNVIVEANFNELPSNRNLLNIEETVYDNDVKLSEDESMQGKSDNTENLSEHSDDISNENKVLGKDPAAPLEEPILGYSFGEVKGTPDSCMANEEECMGKENEENHGDFAQSQEETQENEENSLLIGINYNWESVVYVSLTAFTTLLFSLGYYYIENMRRDKQLIAKINKLERELLVSIKECTALDENLKSTKSKLTSIEDESFGSNEMVLSLKIDLEASQKAKLELEDQIAALEKDLESATEAGLELERMLREVLSSNNEVNPLAQSVDDLRARLNTQQTANESLKKALDLKTQEIEALTGDLTSTKKRCEELEGELMQTVEKLNAQTNLKNSIEQTLTDRVQQLEAQLKNISTEKLNLYKELKNKEAEMTDLTEVIKQVSSNNIDLEKLYEVSHIKAEATQLLEERDELKVRLSEVEGAHNLLEEHMKLVKEEISSLSEQCKIADKEKKDAETRLDVLSKFFKEKEAERQKEEAVWLEKQGEVASTVERIQTMQNELQSYRQQVEMLKREILDQEREYKLQISALETKAHEQWVIARQNERRLEESKAEAGQLRNRLTLVEKNINDADSDGKLHRLEANGETTTSPPLFLGADSSSSPIMFGGSSGVPPLPPPSYLTFPPYLPIPLPTTSGIPPYDVGQRPPPLGGRLSSPPPMPLHPPAPSSRYEGTGSPPPPMSPPRLPPPFDRHRSPPPPPYGSDRIHPPPPPLSGMMYSPPGTTHSWVEGTLPPSRNTGFHPHQREQRTRNHKGSLHSSGESLDKTHLSGKI